jgi:serine phosphatase RsbU (regulator of sigma subunit)
MTLRKADGTIQDFTSPGRMLGLRAADAGGSVTVYAPPGSMLVFFTDGLTETTHDIDEGFRRLHDILADADVTAAEDPARAIVDRVLDGQPATDNIAVLTVTFA